MERAAEFGDTDKFCESLKVVTESSFGGPEWGLCLLVFWAKGHRCLRQRLRLGLDIQKNLVLLRSCKMVERDLGEARVAGAGTHGCNKACHVS